MKISGMTKLTVQDYPGEVACIIFTQGCNFKCSFCHNSQLIPIKECDKSNLSEREIFDYLETRKNILDGVVVSGGEPLIQPGIKDLIKKIKEMGFKVKLDTNGTNHNLLKELIKDELIDYVAMDIKADLNIYAKITGHIMDYTPIKKSVELITKSNIDHEFRTTIIKEFHDLPCLENICNLIGSSAKYYLQNFTLSDGVIDKNLNGFSQDELLNIEIKLKEKFPNVKVRDL